MMRPYSHRFLGPSGVDGNVVFNFRRQPVEDLWAFACGYHAAGKRLVAALRDTGYADYDGYPILFLYRHSLELYIKAVVYRGAILMGLIGVADIDTTGLFRSHNLIRWLPALKAVFAAMRWGDFRAGDIESFDDFSDLVRAIDAVDSGSYAFRYPIKSDTQPLLPHHFVVNVIDFGSRMDPVLQALEGAYIGIDDRIDAESELRYEVSHFLAEE